ncbi:MAG TPA: DNA mismatch repair endonuclease MutL [Patescibacteria group bacterium]|nr:DNA mismatch repair endonuclease MutL [Patescibacteria group bacterium]
MNRIRLLPEQVANQIAAGEVVERPASVVKELVENSLDAQATRLSVEVQAGGRSLVRVSDDGIGMSRDDALLCLERHATSKILRAEDLAAISTMGFRGEALPSIASVSRFILTTRERESDSPEGTQIVISAGKILEVKAAASAPGSTVEVRQIFFNLPARRKFLRSEETESAHIQHYLTLAALAFPEVAFTFVKDTRTVWQLPAVKSGTEPNARLSALRDRLRSLYGAEEKLLPVDSSFELSSPGQAVTDEVARSGEPDPPTSCRLWGFIGAPGVSRATREDQHLFVNRRPVENRGLNFALLEGYHTSLMKGRYPVCCLFLEIDPAAVDVNIHPAKREVRFRSEADVRRFVARAVRQSLLQFHSAEPTRGLSAGPPQPAETGARSSQTSLPDFPRDLQPPAPDNLPAHQPALAMGFSPPLRTVRVQPVTPVQAPGHTSAGPQPAATQAPCSPSAGSPPPTPLSSAAMVLAAAVPLLHVPLRLVGVVGRLYVVLESDRGLVLLDQHAAHERVLFEQMLNRLEQSARADSQKLLLPETVELSARDAHFLREQLPVLARLGVGLSEFGERTFLLDALPPFVKVAEPRRFVLQVLDELKAAGQQVNSLRLGEHVVAKTVCRHAVKANDPLSGPELEKLIADLRQCAMPYTCPHGRPTLVEMNFRELEKKFGRSQ